MTSKSSRQPTRESGGSSRSRQIAPALTLVLISPIISEVLSGSTRLSYLFVLIPEIGVWGCGALLIRYFVRRRSAGGWVSILFLGIALAIAEEFIIQQTSLAPTAGLDPSSIYGRFLGINWIYAIWALGYESIWVVVLPISLAEIIFPARKEEAWIGRRGAVLASIYFSVGALLAWYSWTRIEAPALSKGVASYSPPISYVLIAVAVISFLIFSAWKLAGQPESSQQWRDLTIRHSIQWGVELISSFVLSLGWFALVFLAEGADRNIPVPLTIIYAISLALGAFFLVRCLLGRIPSVQQDLHRLALIFGAMLGSMTAGIISFRANGALFTDFVGDIMFNIIAILLMAYLAFLTKNRCMSQIVQR